MWLIVGLGNPGKVYANTRHNIGFMVVDALASKYSVSLKYKTKSFIYGRGFIEDEDTILIKPLMFMNRSGIAVRDAIQKYADIDNVIVIHDDLDLNTGILRIKKSGSAGGHRGIESVIEAIGTRDFLRVKIGIGRSDRILAEDYVLAPFPKSEQPQVKKTIEKAVNAIVTILTKGVSYAQNEFHRDNS